MIQYGKVSIVTPMYKGAKFVGETIETVLNQSYQNWELIVVDDCSPDGGAGIAIVSSYAINDSRIKLISLKKNLGSSGARNKGIRCATGVLLAFLDADDLWDRQFLERQLSFMRDKKAGIVYCSYRRVADDDSSKEVLSPYLVSGKVDYGRILKSLPIFISTTIIDVRAVGSFDFDERMGSLRDDYVFWLYLLKNKVDYAHGNPEILVSYRLRKDSVTASKLKVVLPHWHVLRHVENLSLPKSLFYLGCWACTGLKKYRKTIWFS